MGDIGKLLPAFEQGEDTQQWRVPIAVFDLKTGKRLKIISIYEDEGFFCIDINGEWSVNDDGS